MGTEGDELQLNSKASCKDNHFSIDTKKLGLKPLNSENEYETDKLLGYSMASEIMSTSLRLILENLKLHLAYLIFLIIDSINVHSITNYYFFNSFHILSDLKNKSQHNQELRCISRMYPK